MPDNRKKIRSNAGEAPLKRIKALVRDKPPFRDERLAPDVDHAQLLALVRQELPEASARALYRLVHSFKSWSDAYCDLVVREFRSTQRSAADTG